MNKLWYKTPFVYFSIAALLGLILRWSMKTPLPGVDYKFFLHAHSHIALLGWAYLAFFFLMIRTGKDYLQSIRSYRHNMYFTQITVLGMLFSFPFQGYGAVSITFSTLFLFATYWFAFRYWKDLNKREKIKNKISSRFFKAGLFYLVLSSLGPWGLGALMANNMGGTDLYFLSIYFYLHFLYNGFFSFAALGLFFQWLEQQNIAYDKKKGRRIFLLFQLACVPTFALSTLWMQPHSALHWIGGLGALAQLMGFLMLTRLIKDSGLMALIQNKTSLYLLQGSLFCLGIKLMLQLFSAWPYFADMAYRHRDFIIAYLHLTLLGFISLFIISHYSLTGMLDMHKKAVRLGTGIFAAGFILMELILVLRPSLSLFNYVPPQGHQELLIGASVLLAAGIIFITKGLFTGKNGSRRF